MTGSKMSVQRIVPALPGAELCVERESIDVFCIIKANIDNVPVYKRR